MDKKTYRLEKLKELLKEQGFVSIRTLSQLLDVSEMTVRRDLKALEKLCALPEPPHIIKNAQEYSILQELQKQGTEKASIGDFAASLVHRNDILIIDTGTTTERIAKMLPQDLNLTVLTYCSNILDALQRNPGIHILFAGGSYHRDTQMFESREGIQFINCQRAYKVFLSAAGVHADLGITCANNYEVSTKQAVMGSAVEKILVADSSKFGIVRPAHFCDLGDINVIITDSGLPAEWRELILNQGITLHLV